MADRVEWSVPICDVAPWFGTWENRQQRDPDGAVSYYACTCTGTYTYVPVGQVGCPGCFCEAGGAQDNYPGLGLHAPRETCICLSLPIPLITLNLLFGGSKPLSRLRFT